MTKQWEPLTDYQWAAFSPFLNLKRKRKIDLREVMDAVLWLLRTGAQWRNLGPQWPHWQAVYYYYNQWKRNTTFERINIALNQADRQREGRDVNPSVLCIDSQSRSADAVKLAPFLQEVRGLDANKRVNGRKRQLLVGLATV